MKTKKSSIISLLVFTVFILSLSINAYADYKMLLHRSTPNPASCIMSFDDNGVYKGAIINEYGTPNWKPIGYEKRKALWYNFRDYEMTIWNFDNDGNTINYTVLPHPGEFIPVSFADRKILLKHRYNGSFAIWNVTEDNRVYPKIYTGNYGTPLFCDNRTVVFKTGVNVQLWSISPSRALVNPSRLFYVGTSTQVRFRKTYSTAFGKLILYYNNRGSVLTIRTPQNTLVGEEQFQGTAVHGPFPEGKDFFGKTAYWQLIDYIDYKLIWKLVNTATSEFSARKVTWWDEFLSFYTQYDTPPNFIIIDVSK